MIKKHWKGFSSQSFSSIPLLGFGSNPTHSARSTWVQQATLIWLIRNKVFQAFSDEEIKGFIQIPFSLPKIPCHTQAVEHGICVITEAATSVIDPEARDGFIRHKLKLQRDIGSCNTKKEFFPVFKKDASQEWKVWVSRLAPHLSFKSHFPLFCSDCSCWTKKNKK